MLSHSTMSTNLKSAGWLLVLSPLAFVAMIITGIATLFSNDIGNFDDIVAQQMAVIRSGWVAFHLFYALATTIGCIGIIMVSTRLLRTGLNGTRVRLIFVVSSACAALAILGVIWMFVLRSSLVNFTDARLGLASGYVFSDNLTQVSIYLGAVATGLTGLGLSIHGTLRRVGLVVAVITLLYLVTDIVFGQHLPPFVISLLWIILGIGLLRRKTVE